MYKLATEHKLFLNEDIQLCLTMRDQLEQCGMKYSPIELAKNFAVEGFGPQTHAGIDLTKLFGHHSSYLKLVDRNTIDSRLGQSSLNAIYREVEKISLLKGYGYSINMPVE